MRDVIAPVIPTPTLGVVAHATATALAHKVGTRQSIQSRVCYTITVCQIQYIFRTNNRRCPIPHLNCWTQTQPLKMQGRTVRSLKILAHGTEMLRPETTQRGPRDSSDTKHEHGTDIHGTCQSKCQKKGSDYKLESISLSASMEPSTN